MSGSLCPAVPVELFASIVIRRAGSRGSGLGTFTRHVRRDSPPAWTVVATQPRTLIDAARGGFPHIGLRASGRGHLRSLEKWVWRRLLQLIRVPVGQKTVVVLAGPKYQRPIRRVVDIGMKTSLPIVTAKLNRRKWRR